jgi:hypothetical protein
MANEVFDVSPVLTCSDNTKNSPVAKQAFCLTQIFRPSSKGFFTFRDGQVFYQGAPGSVASLYIDKFNFPLGLSLMAFELMNFSAHTLDCAFELVVRRIDGSVSHLSPFDLVQAKRGVFSFCEEFFSHVIELRFSNLEAVNSTHFKMGLFMIRY